jgi:hypothetical protein
VAAGKRLRRLLAAAVLALAFAALGKPAPATCRCGSGSLEVVLVIDTTSSMHLVMGTVKEQMNRLIAALEGVAEQVRVGVVLFRAPGAPEYVVRALPLTGDRAAAAAWIAQARVQGGGDEAVELALEEAVERMPWSRGARKVIVLVGDEGPTPAGRERGLKLARLAAGRGIAVNAVTCSLTAWSYWQLENREAWLERLRLQGERAKREFRLPVFDEIAAAGGGMSVPGYETREILKWLLALSAGEEAARIDLRRFEEWRPAEAAAPAGRAPMLCQLRHGGDWETPRNFEALRAELGRRMRLEFDSARETVLPNGNDLAQRPLLYLSGHGKIVLTPGEEAGLRGYLEGGGLLWADACCGSREFDASLRELLGRLLPAGGLAPLPGDHPVLSSGHVIASVRAADRPRQRDTGFTERPPRLEGLTVNGRLAVIYSPDSLGCGWATYPMGAGCQLHDEDALRLSVNILLYALTRPPEPPRARPER